MLYTIMKNVYIMTYTININRGNYEGWFRDENSKVQFGICEVGQDRRQIEF